MIISCEKCETKFLVKAEQLGDKGRKVRCGNCAHVWLQKPADAAAVAKEKEVIKQQQENLQQAAKDKAAGIQPSLPAVFSKPKAIKRLRVAAVILLALNVFGFIFFNKGMIGQTGFYDMIGQYQTDGVEISSVKLLPEKIVNGEKVNMVEWSIRNTTKLERNLPARRIRLLDKDLKQIVSGTDKKKVLLKPGEDFKFDANAVPNHGDKGKYIVVDIGNPFELSWR